MAKMVEMRPLLTALPPFLSVSPHIWIDFDREADVLYICFRKPQQAKDSLMEGNLVYHYDGEQLVGVTIMEAQATLQRTQSQEE